MGSTTFLGYGSIAAVVWYGGHLVGQKLMTFGDLTAFILYTFTVAFSVGILTSLWGDLAKALGLDFDGSGIGFGVRSQRYAAIVDDGVVRHVAVEKPMKFEVSSAEAILAAL